MLLSNEKYFVIHQHVFMQLKKGKGKCIRVCHSITCFHAVNQQRCSAATHPTHRHPPISSHPPPLETPSPCPSQPTTNPRTPVLFSAPNPQPSSLQNRPCPAVVASKPLNPKPPRAVGFRVQTVKPNADPLEPLLLPLQSSQLPIRHILLNVGQMIPQICRPGGF